MKATKIFMLMTVALCLATPQFAHSANSEDPRSRRTDALEAALQRGSIDRAEYALERARSLVNLARVRSKWGSVDRPDPHSATLLLRDLAARLDDLNRFEKKSARRILARPSHGASGDAQGHGWSASQYSYHCRQQTRAVGEELEVCVNWVTTTPDAPNPTDNDLNGLPDYVDTVESAFDTVWEKEINELGYRMPLEDGGVAAGDGISTGFDIYIADLGADRLYGYCTNDNPSPTSFTQSAYCVIDDDFNAADYEPGVHGTDALKITLAHEFFHAIQFAYDWNERPFFMEGTAVWVEDEVFDDINANYEYLHDSPLHQPEIPLDAGDWRWDENFEYGSWLWWRFLSERYERSIIREIWENSENAADVFDALETQLAGESSSLAREYAQFALWNRSMDRRHEGLSAYEEGIDYLYAVGRYWPPPSAEFWMGPYWTMTTGKRKLTLDHLTMRYVFLEPVGVPKDAKLKLTVKLPNANVGTPIVTLTGGKLTDFLETTTICTKAYKLNVNKNGVASRTLPFHKLDKCVGRKRPVLWATLILSNGSFADDAVFTYTGKVIN